MKPLLLAIILFAVGCSFAEAHDKKLFLGLTAATIFDVESTYAALDRCGTCYEQNPLVRWTLFSDGKPNRLKAYSYQTSLNIGVAYLTYKLSHRKWYWVIPMIWIGAHVVAGSLNLRYVF